MCVDHDIVLLNTILRDRDAVTLILRPDHLRYMYIYVAGAKDWVHLNSTHLSMHI